MIQPQPLSAPLLADAPSPTDLLAFARDGYLVFENVVPRDKLARLRQSMAEALDRVRKSGALFGGGGNLAGHLNCSPGPSARFIYDALVERGIVGLVKAIDPAVERLPNVGCNYNLPGSVVQHWHMDRPYTNAFMIANVAVVDTTLENGAMEVAPGSHRRFYPYYQFVLERASMRLPSQRVLLRQGDVLVRVSSLWHRGMPNHTDEARPMVAFTWEDGGSLQADPFHTEGGQITFRPNWYRPTMLGRLRERTYVAAPITYDAYRFARSLVGSKGYDH